VVSLTREAETQGAQPHGCIPAWNAVVAARVETTYASWENLLSTRPACSQTKTPCGGCCSTRISVSLTHYTFLTCVEGGRGGALRDHVCQLREGQPDFWMDLS